MNTNSPLQRFKQRHLRACQLKQLTILEAIHDICQRHAIPYWLDGGTLLGAIRHGGFIPWDEDIDIAMRKADMLRFVEVAQKELPKGLLARLRKGPFCRHLSLHSLPHPFAQAC